jgi:hypothetical protein
MDVATPLPNLDSSFAKPETAADVAGEIAPPPDAREAAAIQDATKDGEVDSGTDSPLQGDADAGADVSTDADAEASVDAGYDTGSDAGYDSNMGPPGPHCPSSGGGLDTCNSGEHCCVNAPTRAATCAATCAGGTYPVDCPGASGPGGCGSQSCCGTLVFDGGQSTTNCYVPELTAACSDSCNDNFPAALAACVGTYTVRLCTAAADCAAELNGNIYCCNFGSPPSSFNWCVGATPAGLANSCAP